MFSVDNARCNARKRNPLATRRFSYQQVALSTTAPNSDGSLGSSQTFSWDLALNRADASIPCAGAEALTYSIDEDMVEKLTCTCPPSRSTRAAAVRHVHEVDAGHH